MNRPKPRALVSINPNKILRDTEEAIDIDLDLQNNLSKN